MTKTYNDRRKEYEKERTQREPPSRRTIHQIVSGLLKVLDFDNTDVPTRQKFSTPRRDIHRTYEDTQ